MNTKQQALNLLGMATRAGKLITGDSFSLSEIQSQRAKIVLLASDASDNTRKKFLDKCLYYNIPISSLFTTEEISQAIGKNRTVCVLSDPGFSAKLQELLLN